MDIRNRLYPYPVLCDINDDYTDSSFSMKLDVTQGIREISLNVSLNLDNEEIKALIGKGEAEFVIHIECPYTFYRTIIKTDKFEVKKTIPEHKINGTIQVCAFVVAKIDINGFANSHFNGDYSGFVFSLKRGNIIAIGGQINVKVIKEAEKLSKIPSIFTICRYAEDLEDNISIDLSGQKIVIRLNSKSFNNYKILTGIPDMLSVLHSMIIVPALIYTFEKIKSDGISKFEDHRWFKSLERALLKHNLRLDGALLTKMSSFELSWKCLDMPIDRALDSLVENGETGEEE